MLARIKGSVVVIAAICSHAFAQGLFDPALRVQTYASGFDSPTGAVFLNDQGDLLVTQKNDGRVIIVRNRQIAGTALDLPVNSESERGLLSVALSPNFANDSLVYLYHTAAPTDGASPVSNKVSRYRLVGDELVFDRKVIDLPPGPGPNHDGGKILFDAKGKLYVTIGDLNRNERTQNVNTSQTITATGAILRLNPHGTAVMTNPFHTRVDAGTIAGSRNPIDQIYAYGIRNSFGIAFDPVTGDLWDTENGPDRFDEINRVRPGFNSGWRPVMGPIAQNDFEPGSFVDLGPGAHYSEPKLSWVDPVAPTDLHFYEGSKLGSAYRNDLFAGDVKTGTLYHFDLTSARRSLRLTGPLTDYIVNNEGDLLDESADIRLGEGFGIISDILSGPGGMFVLSLTDGRLYRITQRPAELQVLTDMTFVPVPEPGESAGVLLALPALGRRRRRDRPDARG